MYLSKTKKFKNTYSIGTKQPKDLNKGNYTTMFFPFIYTRRERMNPNKRYFSISQCIN